MIAELVKRYFEGTCTEVEKAELRAYMRSHPEALSEYFSEEEWEQFEAADILDPAVSERMRNRIQQHVGTTRRGHLRSWIAAAAVLLIVGAWIYHFREPADRSFMARSVTVDSTITASNNTKAPVDLHLPDGSTVTLAAQSRIEYSNHYGEVKRDIKLVGKAVFSVAKNKKKPFTVTAEGLATTALGTKFEVAAIRGSKSIKVHLFEGKVVVRYPSRNAQEYYLQPGDHLIFDKSTALAEIIKKKKDVAVSDQGDSGFTAANSWYAFENQQLSEVLNHIQDIYNVKIYYAEADLRDIRFIGRVEKDDSIALILKDICQMNNLQLLKKGDAYYIKNK
jgi:transmembrane sensor